MMVKLRYGVFNDTAVKVFSTLSGAGRLMVVVVVVMMMGVLLAVFR